MEYKAKWEIDLDADSPEEAAKLARDYQRDMSDPVYIITDTEGEEYSVDLTYEEGPTCVHLPKLEN